MQEVVGGLARVVVADEEGEGAPDGVEDGLQVPAHVHQQEAQPDPARVAAIGVFVSRPETAKGVSAADLACACAALPGHAHSCPSRDSQVRA